jgi:hypothetical protein
MPGFLGDTYRSGYHGDVTSPSSRPTARARGAGQARTPCAPVGVTMSRPSYEVPTRLRHSTNKDTP